MKHLLHMARFSGWLLANQWRGPEWQQTGRVMALLEELNLHPLTLVDVGARCSHWARHFQKRLPAMNARHLSHMHRAFHQAHGFRGLRTVFAEFDRELSHTDVAFYRL